MASPPVLVFAGNRIDEPGRSSVRFPNDSVPRVRREVAAVLKQLKPRLVVGAAASGTDLIVLSEAARQSIPTHIVLPLEVERFREVSVADQGPEWVDLFDAALADCRDHSVFDLSAHDDWYLRGNDIILDEADRLADTDPVVGLVVAAPEDGSASIDLLEKLVDRGWGYSMIDPRPDPRDVVRQFLNGEKLDAEVLKPLVGALKRERGGFYWVRRLLTVVLRGDGDRVAMAGLPSEDWAWQQLAIALYKDDGLPREQAFTEAEEILEDKLRLGTTTDPETLGIGGALYKRWWQHAQQVPLLKRSEELYLRGHRVPGNDGYCGVNAAFVSDLLEVLDGNFDPAGESTGDAIRREVIKLVSPLVEPDLPGRRHYFLWATLGEAHFALREFEAARQAFASSVSEADPKPDLWELETTARQLGEIVRIKHLDTEAAWEEARIALQELVHDPEALRTMLSGRVGLALSGGGFRAALFHIGALARLADGDQLRRIDVVSCVSGGSIIGAYYYLELKRLLTDKSDEQIAQQDYVDLVLRVIEGFTAGVQTDIRNQVYASPLANLKLVRSNWNGTRRLGELYEKNLFGRIADGHGGDRRLLRDLVFDPRGEINFDPARRNGWRRNKVPSLYLNTACLNTGHCWQFTGSWMGEPAVAINGDVDANERLRRMYQDQVPDTIEPITLGEAVAASSAVPGLFPPLLLTGLYDDRTVSLVDGGAQDNQGVSTLLDLDCNLVLVSDGSGQLASVNSPPTDRMRVSLRSASSVQHSLRSAYFRDVQSRTSNGALRNSAWIHLKSGLEGGEVNWVDMNEPLRTPSLGLTPYGIDKEVQRSLADLRTDLDAFTDIEANALMLSGYSMMDHALDGWREDVPETRLDIDWPFLSYRRFLTTDSSVAPIRREILRHLTIGSRIFGKLSMYHAPVRTAGRAVAAALLLAVVAAIVRWPSAVVSVAGWSSLVGVALVLVAVIGQRVALLRWVGRWLTALVMATVGWIPGRLYLVAGRPLQLRAGQLRHSVRSR